MADEATPRATAMVIEDEPNMCRVVDKTLRMERYAVEAFTDPIPAMEALPRVNPDIVITDLLMPGIDGMEVLRRVKEFDPTLPCIIITAHATVESAVKAIRNGAFDYVIKPFLLDELLMTVARALELRQLQQWRESVTDYLNRALKPDEPVGVSPAWRAVMDLARKVAATGSAVLLQGETGVGKEVVARAIHQYSPRASDRFVPINCAAIPPDLLESELFGHEKGAFTGAVARRLGFFELAHHGTLFLDEIGDMPMPLQAKLLRVLQNGRIQRVGGISEIQVDARVITATHRDLREEIVAGRFREDLFYRLNVIRITIPPLRERVDDIEALARAFLKQISADSGRGPLHITEGAIALLKTYAWPGNVRELRNVLERAAVLLEGNRIDETVLQAELRTDPPQAQIAPAPPEPGGAPGTHSPYANLTYAEAKDAFERQYITDLLNRAGGNVSAAARHGAMSRRNLYEKMEKLGMSGAIRPPHDGEE